jgi:hypothetical protein
VLSGQSTAIDQGNEMILIPVKTDIDHLPVTNIKLLQTIHFDVKKPFSKATVTGLILVICASSHAREICGQCHQDS